MPDLLEGLRTGAGVQVSRVELLSASSNSIYLLYPDLVVAKVSAHRHEIRVGSNWAERELQVAEYLAGAGLEVVRPCSTLDPGPHRIGSHTVSLWDPIVPARHDVDPRDVGASLHSCHEAMKNFPAEQLSAERWNFSPVDEIASVFFRVPNHHWLPGEAKLLGSLIEFVDSSRERTPERQLLHGDPDERNFTAVADGVCVLDLEDSHVGPPLWDLACMVAPSVVMSNLFRTERLLAGYGVERGISAVAGLHDWVVIRTAHQAVWSAYVNNPGPSIDRVRRLSWLSKAGALRTGARS